MSADGSRVATVGQDESLKVFDVNKRKFLRSSGAVDGVQDVALGHGRSAVVVGRTFRQPLSVIDGRGRVTAIGSPVGAVVELVITPKGNVITLAKDGNLVEWDIRKRAENFHLPVARFGSEVRFALSPDGRRAAFGFANGEVTIWDLVRQTRVTRFVAHQGIVGGISYSPDGKAFVTSGLDKTVRVWNAEEVLQDRQLPDVPGGPRRVAFDAGGRTLLVAYADRAHVLKVREPSAKPVVLSRDNLAMNAVDITPDGASAATADSDGRVTVWDTRTGREITVLDRHPTVVASVALSPDGRKVATGIENVIRLWDARSGRRIRTIIAKGTLLTRRTTMVSFTPDGEYIVAPTVGGPIRMWRTDGDADDEPETLEGHSGPAANVAFAPSHDLMASTGYDATVRIWNWKERKQLKVLQDETVPTSVVFSRDAERIAVLAVGTLSIWSSARRPCRSRWRRAGSGQPHSRSARTGVRCATWTRRTGWSRSGVRRVSRRTP